MKILFIASKQRKEVKGTHSGEEKIKLFLLSGFKMKLVVSHLNFYDFLFKSMENLELFVFVILTFQKKNY